MRKFLFAVVIVIGLCGSAFGQDVPRAELFGGYSYLNLDTNGLSSRQSANGWEATVTGNFNRRIGVEGDFSGYYKTYFDVGIHDYGFLAGPRINFRPAFIHALIGGDHLSALSVSQDSFAGAFGGGVEWPVSRRWAVRTSADYVFTRHNIFGGPSFTQNNIRASVGIVFRFASARERSALTPRERANSPERASEATPTEEVTRLGVAGYATEAGFKITAVGAGSPLEQIYIKAGDVIFKINGHDVRSAPEIESAIATSASATVKVFCLVQTGQLGMMPVERDAKLLR